MKEQAVRRSGYTLVELMCVMTIIALLLTMVGGLCALALRKAKEAQAKVEIEEIKISLTTFKHQTGRYPTSIEFQGEPFHEILSGRVDLDRQGRPIDPWDSPYIYSSNRNVSYGLFSGGHDRAYGTTLTDADNII